DELRVADALARDLGEAVRNAVAPVARPEIRGEVDRACASVARARDPFFGGAVRQRAEYERDVAQRRVFGGDERGAVSAKTHRGTALIVRGGKAQLEQRVVEHQAAQLATGVAARA